MNQMWKYPASPQNKVNQGVILKEQHFSILA